MCYLLLFLVWNRKWALANNPVVPISPENAIKISFYSYNIRPQPKTEGDHVYVFLTRGGRHLASSDALQFAILSFKVHAPEIFCLGTQRRALQTELSCSPVEG